MAAIESTIADALVAKVTAVAGVNSVAFDRVRISIDEFRPHEIPAVQFFDVGQVVTHVHTQKEVTWSIALEIIMKTKSSGVIDQQDLWNLRRDIELVLWDKPNLGIPEIQQLTYTGVATDLHLLHPYYVARMDFDVNYIDALTGSC